MPENFPSYAFSSNGVLPALSKPSARTVGGLIVTSTSTDPHWRGRLTTGLLEVHGENNQYADFLAWLSRAVDLNIRVDFIHPRHRLPRTYTDADWPAPGPITIASLVNLRTLSLAGLTAGLVLKRGDRISFSQGDIVVHRWIAADTVVSSVISESISVTPRLPLGVLAPGATVSLEDPVMRMMVLADSWDAIEVAEPSTISFEVVEAVV